MSDKKGLGMAAALAGAVKDSPKAKKDEDDASPDFDKLFDDACEEMMKAHEKRNPKAFKRALRAALRSHREKD